MFSHPLGRYYWGNIENFASFRDGVKLPLKQEGWFWTVGEKTSFEEIRNILGSKISVEEYEEGDDLCENLYRLSIGKMARANHKSYRLIGRTYIPDQTVLERIVSTVADNYSIY